MQIRIGKISGIQYTLIKRKIENKWIAYGEINARYPAIIKNNFPETGVSNFGLRKIAICKVALDEIVSAQVAIFEVAPQEFAVDPHLIIWIFSGVMKVGKAFVLVNGLLIELVHHSKFKV